MSRDLPARPHLDHLRKQAKDLLRELQQRKPDAQLSDAQHAIAREYGFASWPKLRAHVEARVQESPFVGTWVANVSKSKRHPLNQFQAATMRFDVVGDAVTITHTGVTEAGQEESDTHTIQADGRERPRGQNSRYTALARWLGPRALEAVEMKDGEVLAAGRYEVSADGRTMTISDAGGAQVVVCDRRD